MYLHKTVRALKKLFALEGGVGIGVKSNERCGTVHVMQRYEARTRKSEVVRWPGGIRHWQCGSARGGKGGTREQRLESSSSESFLRCTQPATIPRGDRPPTRIETKTLNLDTEGTSSPEFTDTRETIPISRNYLPSSCFFFFHGK